MNHRKPHKTFFIMTLVAALALVVALAPLSEAGKRSKLDNKTESAWLGVQIQTVDAELVERYDLETKSGVYVEAVVDGSPADDAGVRPGDIILEFNRAKLQSADELIDLVAEAGPGDEVTLSINRNGRAVTEVVTLGKREHRDERRFFAWRLGPEHSYSLSESLSNTYIGVSLETITGQLLAYFGSDEGSGALIKKVAEDSPAEKAGLEAGDVIVKVAGEEIESLDDVQDAVRATDENETIELTILRNKREKLFTVTVEKRASSFFNREVFDRDLFDRDVFDRSLGSRSYRRFGLDVLPRMRGLSRGSIGPGSLYLDLDDNAGQMKRLRREMRKMRRELNRMRKDIDGK